LVLDEVDKLGIDMRGDPAAALLEVLDPDENETFQDHYIDTPFDLSQVTFLATANDYETIPPALLDRMEVIDVSGYTRHEKLCIAREFLVPKQLSEHGITDERLEFVDEGIETIIERYTREAGVRNLEREIAATCRYVAVRIAEGADVHEKATQELIERVLGPQKYVSEVAERVGEPGVATGLAWTPSGGRIVFIEASKMVGKGNLTLTGNMRNIMQESATTAVSFVRSHAERLMLSPEWLRAIDLHVHIPQGGIPTDGPSAGVTVFTAVASLLLDCPVKPDVGMTGEITLRGNVLPVSGIKEKILAAHRAGLKTVLIPRRNERDLDDVPAEVRAEIDIKLIGRMDEILSFALDPPRSKPADSITPPPPPAQTP
jgi:ATP-dependent Lon protease